MNQEAELQLARLKLVCKGYRITVTNIDYDGPAVTGALLIAREIRRDFLDDLKRTTWRIESPDYFPGDSFGNEFQMKAVNDAKVR